jgi:hypothetical protein
MGREDALEAIDKALTGYEGRVAVTALQGLRGVVARAAGANCAWCLRMLLNS